MAAVFQRRHLKLLVFSLLTERILAQGIFLAKPNQAQELPFPMSVFTPVFPRIEQTNRACSAGQASTRCQRIKGRLPANKLVLSDS
jgi:hypothetical protein